METALTVYLCGPINGKTDEECMDWRKSIAQKLQRFSNRVLDEVPCLYILDPMRRDYRGIEKDYYSKIVSDDCFDILASDVIVANCQFGPSWGTAMELWFAHSHNKPIIVICKEGVEDKLSPWLRYVAKQITTTVEGAVVIIGNHYMSRPATRLKRSL